MSLPRRFRPLALAVSLACGPLSVLPAHAASPAVANVNALRRPLAAGFGLQVDRDPAVRGTLWFDGAGQTCVQITEPLEQRIWMGKGAMVLYHPKEAKVFRQTLGDKSLPPFLDAIVVSLRAPSESLPQGASLVGKRTVAEGVEEIWRIDQPTTGLKMSVRAVEGPAGVVQTEVLDGDGVLLRKYRFGDRRNAHRVSLAGRVDASYFAKGKLQRSERWTLNWQDRPGAVPRDERTCLRITGKPSETKL